MVTRSDEAGVFFHFYFPLALEKSSARSSPTSLARPERACLAGRVRGIPQLCPLLAGRWRLAGARGALASKSEKRAAAGQAGPGSPGQALERPAPAGRLKASPSRSLWPRAGLLCAPAQVAKLAAPMPAGAEQLQPWLRKCQASG